MTDLDNKVVAGITLIGSSALLLIVGFLTGRGDITSATLVLVGVGSFIAGVLLITQHRGESLFTWVAGLASAGSVIDLARLCADLGVQGNAHFYPGSKGIVQVVPVGEKSPSVRPADDYSYISKEYGGGVCLLPTGRSLYDWLVKEYSLIVSENFEGLRTSMREVGEEALEIADTIEVVLEGDLIEIRLEGFKLIEGCTAIRSVSPKICTMIACPICSLFSCMVVASFDRPCWIEHVSIVEKERSVRLLLHLLGSDLSVPDEGTEKNEPQFDRLLPISDVITEESTESIGLNLEKTMF